MTTADLCRVCHRAATLDGLCGTCRPWQPATYRAGTPPPRKTAQTAGAPSHLVETVHPLRQLPPPPQPPPQPLPPPPQAAPPPLPRCPSLSLPAAQMPRLLRWDPTMATTMGTPPSARTTTHPRVASLIGKSYAGLLPPNRARPCASPQAIGGADPCRSPREPRMVRDIATDKPRWRITMQAATITTGQNQYHILSDTQTYVPARSPASSRNRCNSAGRGGRIKSLVILKRPARRCARTYLRKINTKSGYKAWYKANPLVPGLLAAE
jgi:hypothetical protein